MALLVSADWEPTTYSYYERLIRNPTPYLVFDKYAQMAPLPKGQGKTVRFRKRGALTVNKVPAGEGVTPPIESFSKVDLYATIQQFIRRFGYSDIVEFTSPDKELTEAVKDVNELCDETKDEIVRDVLLGCPSVYYAGNVANRASIVTGPATGDLTGMERTLLGALATPIHEKRIKASTGISTEAVDKAFVLICHPDAKVDFEGLTGFIKAKDYANSDKAEENEFGSYGMFRCVHTTKADVQADSGGSAVAASLKYTTANTACDVYRSIILSKDAYAVCDLAGEGKDIIIKKPGEGDDDAHQRTRVSYKMAFAGRILNDSFMYIYEHGVSE